MILKISLRAKAGVPETLVKQKLHLPSLCFPQNTLMSTESRREFSDLHYIFWLRAPLFYICIALCFTSDAITFDLNWHSWYLKSGGIRDASNDVLIGVIRSIELTKDASKFRVLLNCGLQTAEAAEPPEPPESAEHIFFSVKKDYPKKKLFLKNLTVKKNCDEILFTNIRKSFK